MAYPNEDEMPHRCGIIHCRGAVPTGQITQSEGKCGRTLVTGAVILVVIVVILVIKWV